MPDLMTTHIQPKTILILGAGASFDCNFPLGNSLIDAIIHDTHDSAYVLALKRIVQNNAAFIKANSQLYLLPKPVVAQIKKDPKQIIRLPNDVFTDWTKDLHHFESIDRFIYYRKDYSIIARLCILLTLSSYEKTKIFDHWIRDSRHGVRRIWYHSLWTNIVQSSPTLADLKNILDSMHFITFNYDRSLEYFLLKSIKAMFPESDFKAKDLPITHIYGKLGTLDNDDNSYRAYAPLNFTTYREEGDRFGSPERNVRFEVDRSTDNAYAFHEADVRLMGWAMQIETYTDVYDSKKAQVIQQAIKKAQNVYIFGFSFQQQNNNILFSTEALGNPAKADGVLDGTCYEMAEQRILELRSKLHGYFHRMNPKFMTEDWKPKHIGHYFKDYSVRIPKPDPTVPRFFADQASARDATGQGA